MDRWIISCWAWALSSFSKGLVLALLPKRLEDILKIRMI